MADIAAAPIELLDYVGDRRRLCDDLEGNQDTPIGLDGFKARVAAMRARAAQMPICGIAGINAGKPRR